MNNMDLDGKVGVECLVYQSHSRCHKSSLSLEHVHYSLLHFLHIIITSFSDYCSLSVFHSHWSLEIVSNMFSVFLIRLYYRYLVTV